MRKHIKKIIFFMLTVTMVISSFSAVFARASDYISQYNMSIDPIGSSGKLSVFASVSTFPTVDKLEVSLSLQKFTSSGWVEVGVFKSTTSTGNYAFISTTYQGEVGSIYRGVGTYTATKGSDVETRTGTGSSCTAYSLPIDLE